MILRDYQEEALEALKRAWKDEDARRVIIVLPTGGGKTVVFSHLSRMIIDASPDKRVLILVDRDALVRQTVDKIGKVAAHLTCGVVKARENETSADVIVASVQTLRNPKRLEQVRNVALLIVDECDLAAAPSYVKILDHYGCFTPGGVRAVGFTATPYRSDGKLGTVWQEIVYSKDISWMIRNGHLIPPRGIAVEVPDLNLAGVKSTRKDFREGELGEALADSLAPELIAKAIKEHAADRKTLAFFPTVASAYVFAEAIEAEGISAEVVHGGMSQADQDAVLARHKRGSVVVNCMILTVGYDDPEVDCIVIGRPTKSKRLYVQIVGRGLRVDPERPYEEQDCLLLDVVGANGIHDLRSMADLSDRKIDPTEARSNKTLTELEDEFDAGEGVAADEGKVYDGPVEYREFDPLGRGRTPVTWKSTKSGTAFLTGGTQVYLFLAEWPAPGQWSVCWCTTSAFDPPLTDRVLDHRWFAMAGQKPRSVGMTVHRGIPKDAAVEVAEELAGCFDMDLSNRKARWRGKQPSEKLLHKAHALGVATHDGMRAGEVSDLIDTVLGSRRIDPLVARLGGSNG